MSTYELTGTLFAQMVRGGAENLKNNADVVNDLNVFPIPDGDTGDNMSRTIEGGALNATASELCATSEQVAEGMLLSARGNSGVILSQFFEGVSRRLAGTKSADTELLGEAFRSGVRQAYSAVVKPTEGTMLTVMREATERAAESVGFSGSLEEFFDVFMTEMHASLDRTPTLLPVLREAGVIDSGGAGFVYIVEGMTKVLKGELIVENENKKEYSSPEATKNSFGPDSKMEYGYCTELLIQLMNAKCEPESFEVKELIGYLESIGGDSIVAFRTGSVVKLHVHTMTPSKVLDYCQRFGEFISVKIENMCIQHSETQIANRYPASRASSETKERRPFAVVTVCGGEGLREMFTGFGADYIVDGQQTMNPATEDFIKAFDEVCAEKIIVLPNNSNIILTAKQAGELYDKSEVYVVPSKTIAEGYAAFTMLDLTSGDIDTILDSLTEAVAQVSTGLVTYAVRDSVTNGIAVKKDDWLGFDSHTLVACSETGKTDAAMRLYDSMDKSGKEVVIIIAGKDATRDEQAELSDYIRKNSGGMEVYEVDGGQDIYSFIFAVE